MLIIANLNRAENLLALDRVAEALEAIEAGRAAGADSDAYKAVLLTLEARAALRLGDGVRARRSVAEFRQFVAGNGADQSGVSWEDGIGDLLAQIDEIDRSLRQ